MGFLLSASSASNQHFRFLSQCHIAAPCKKRGRRFFNNNKKKKKEGKGMYSTDVKENYQMH